MILEPKKETEITIEFDSNKVVLKILKIISLIIGRKFFWRANYKYSKENGLEMKLVDLLENNKIIVISSINNPSVKKIIDVSTPNELDDYMERIVNHWREGFLQGYTESHKTPKIINFNIVNLSLRITHFLYCSKIQKEIFEPIIADWQEEYFEALFKKEIWKARWINVRYTYAFLAAMWMKSPLGDLIEFIMKFAK